MNTAAGKFGILLFFSVLAVAAVAGSVLLTRRADAVADCQHAAWGASAG